MAQEGLFEQLSKCSEGGSHAKIQRRVFQAEGIEVQRPEARPMWPKQTEERMVGNGGKYHGQELDPVGPCRPY